MQSLKELEDILVEAKKSGEYWEVKIPISMMKMDVELNRIIDKYDILSIEEKKLIRNGISTDIAWLLLGFAINMATYTLRLSEQKYFSNGLIALGMVLGILDQREIILIMSLYYDVSKRNKMSFDKIISQNDEFATFVKNYLNRNEEDKTLESTGYILTKDENNNLIYKRTW